MPIEDHYIERPSLSDVWLEAMRILIKQHEAAPLIVSVTGFSGGAPEEDIAVRDKLDNALLQLGKQTCQTVANTIFPDSLWNPTQTRSLLFERYSRILPRICSLSTQNRFGTYFQRLITGGAPNNRNQLDFVISNYTARGRVRRSALQVSVFDPVRDHTSAALRGFPCLQHITFAPHNGGLQINAFYAVQYMVERAYGNYLGLCRLGRFVAHELELPLTRMTCFTGIARLDVTIGEARRLII